MRLADLFNTDAGESGIGSLGKPSRTGLLLYGLGDIMRGGSGSGAINMGGSMLETQMAEQASEQERQARQQRLQQMQGLFGGGGGGYGQTPGFNPNAPNPLAPQQTPNPAGLPQSVVSAVDRVDPQYSALPNSLVRTESGGRLSAKNQAVGSSGRVGHFGRGQFGLDRLDEAKAAGVIPRDMTPEQFMNDAQAQQRTEQWHVGDISGFVRDQGLDRYIGTSINGVPVTPQGMLAVAHLGGKNGLKRFLESGGQYNPSDANGTSLLDYLGTHAGGGGGDGSYRTAQAGGMAQPPWAAQAVAALNEPDEIVSPAAKRLILKRYDQWMAQNEPIRGRDRFYNVDGVLYDVTGDGPPRAVTERQVELSAKEEEIERLISTQNISRERATAIADDVIVVNRDPTTERIQITNTATNETWEPRVIDPNGAQSGAGQPQQPPQGQPQTQPEQRLGAGDSRFGTPYQDSGDVFGVGGMLRRGANAVSDAVTGNPVFPEASQTQRDYDVLREDLTQDMQGAYGQRVPSWALQAIRDLTPAAGTMEGAGAAQDKLQALGRRFEQELQSVQQTLGSGAQRRMSPADIDALRSQAGGLRRALGKIENALQGFQDETMQLRPEVEDRMRAYE